jgi:predicted permease
MSVRLAIGAGRARLVRQLLTESVVLAMLSAAAGLLVAWWGTRLLLAIAADGAAPIPVAARMDLPVLGFTLALSVLAVGLFGLLPALRASRVDLASAMRASGQSIAGGAFGHRGQRAPLGRLVIAVQVALSLVLLVGAGLLTRSVTRLMSADLGLDRDHLLIVDVDARAAGHTGERLQVLTRRLSERFIRTPGVAAVAYSNNGIFSGRESTIATHVPGFTASAPDDTLANFDRVSAGYVHAIGGRLLRGREFTDADADGARVVMINSTMERFYFDTTSAIGKTVRLEDSTVAEIIGVVEDVTDRSLNADPVRRIYLPYDRPSQGSPGSLIFALRTTGDPALLATAVRQAILAVDANMPIYGIHPLHLRMRQSIREQRLLARLAAGFGGLALLLAAVGLYGVMTYAITRRTGELGLRFALGAQRRDVVAMVLGDALRLVLLGVIVGVPLALAATRLLRNQLHDIDPADPMVIAVSLIVLTLSAILAALIPAIRAARVSPVVALQQG